MMITLLMYCTCTYLGLVSPTEHVFYYACKLWTPKRDKQFGEMVTACKVICPGYADLFELMKVRMLFSAD